MTKPMLNGSLMFPSDYLAAEEFGGKDFTLTIKSIKLDNLKLSDGTTEQKPVLTFNKTKKKLVLNKTNATVIAQLHGAKAERWIGKSITFYPTTCAAFGQTVDCIRVRPTAPATKSDPVPAKDDTILALATPDANEADFQRAVGLTGMNLDEVKSAGGSKLLMAIDNEAWQAAIEMVAGMMGAE